MKLNGNRRSIVLLGALGAVLVIVFLVVLFHDPLLKASVPPLARLAGYDVALDSIHLGSSDFTASDLVVKNLAGEPVATVEHVAIGFDARDLLPGGKTLYGLRSVDIESPHVTLIHHLDGTYNIALPHGNTQTSSGPLAPLDATIRLRDGSASIIDDGRLYRETRRLGVEHLRVEGVFRPHAPSSYDLSLSLREDGRAYPVAGHGYLDDARGIESNRIRAAEIPIGPLVDYAINTQTVHITRGSLVDLDVRYFGIPDRSGTIVRHLGVGGRIVDFTLQLGFLARPLRGGTGDVFAYDDGLAIPRLTGTIADVPVTVAGGIYDFAKPTFRLGVAGSGALAQLVTLSSAAKRFPVGGTARFGLLVVGDATTPLTFARFSSPRISYQQYPFDGVRGLVAIFGTDTTVLDSALAYGGASLGARGNITAKKHTDIEFLANLSAPSNRIPYADSLLPGMTIAAQAVAYGRDAKLETAGVAFGDTSAQHLAGLFAIAPDGVGRAGPLTLTGPGDESLVVDAALDRPHGDVDAILDTRNVRVTNTRVAGLPGVNLPSLPPFALALDSSLGASVHGKTTGVAGTASVYDATLRGVPLGRVAVRAAASGGSNPGATRLAATGTYDGSLDDLARLGGHVPAHGNVSLEIGALAVGTHAIAQVRDTRLDRTSIDGVALTGIDATIGIRGKSVDVYEARAALGPGTVVASGSFGDGGTLSLATSAVDLAALSSVPNLPVRHGTVSAVATVGGTASAPTLDAGVVASGVSVGRYAAGGSTSLSYAGDRLTIASGLFDLAGAVATLDGGVSGLRPGSIHPDLDLRTEAKAVDIGALATLAKAPLYPTGSVDADLTVRGPATAPGLAGSVTIPEGSINGLDYRDVRTTISGTAKRLELSNGHATVGTSRLAFAADLAAPSQRLTLAAPALDLADFNDYFDAADTLAGHGNLSLALTHDPDHLGARARVNFTGVELRHIPLGDARLAIDTRGRTISTSARVGDTHGLLTLDGGVTVPASQLQHDTLHRTSLALRAGAHQVDLEHWLPIFGIQAPVAGLVEANATVAGMYPALDIAAGARLGNGRIGRLDVTDASLAARSQRGRITVTAATFDVPNLSTTLSGSAGLRPTDPIDLTVRSTTSDLGALSRTLGIVPAPEVAASGAPATPSPHATVRGYDIGGAAQVALSLGGTLVHPSVDTTLDLQKLRYTTYTIPRAHAEARLTHLATNYKSGRIDLRGTEIDLASGRITASGSAPFETAPIAGLGPRTAPVSFALGFERVDLGQFGALLPKGTKLGGALAGSLALGGTVAAPTSSGALNLTQLAFSGPQESQKITNGTARVALSGHTVTLSNAHVDAGGGTIDATARATIADLHDLAASTTYIANAVFNHPLLGLPGLYRGRLDGTLGVSKASAGAHPLLSGQITASDARIPYTALLPPTPSGTPGPPPPPVDLALGVTAGKDVRVQSGPVDIGAQGHIDVTGTVSSPKASGKLESTGGSVNFYRNFQLQSGTVAFDPDNGVVPSINAQATTSIQSPATDVTLDVTGLATSLNVGLTSDPSYSKQQILGLLVGLNNYGAVAGVPGAAGGPAPTAGSLATNYATGQVATLFQQQLLEPLSANLGQAIGGNLGVNYAPGGGFNLNAKRQIIKHVDAVFAETFGYPQRSSYGLVAAPNDHTGIQLTIFQQAAANRFDIAPQALQSTNDSVTGAEPQNGTNGYSFSFQRKF